MESWPTGKVVVLTPSIPAHLNTSAVQRAFDLRLRANLTGRCPSCGASATLPNRHARRKAEALGVPPHATMEHESTCPVGDDVFGKLSAGMN